MSDSQRRQLESLISALCDGALDAHQQAQLEQMLRDSAECRHVYLQYLDMHARLTVHPNLTSGIPLPSAVRAAVSHDDHDDHDEDAVFDRARASLDALSKSAEQARQRQRRFVVGRWLALAMVLLVAVMGWRFYDAWRASAELPVIERLIGTATIKSASDSTLAVAAKIGRRLSRGEQLVTASDDGRAVLRYADGTKVVVSFDSSVEIPAQESDVHLRLLQGTIEVDAAPQPADHPLIFATDHARYVVLGTRFRLYRETEASRLELDEGKVRLERKTDGKAVNVEAGFVAVATADTTPLDVQPLPVAQVKQLVSLSKAGQAVTFSADGKLLATGDWERGLKTWIPGESTPCDKYESKIGRSSGLALVDDTLIQIGSDNHREPLILWRVGDTTATTFSLSDEEARSRAIAPDGSCVVESDNAGTHVYAIDPARLKTSPRLRADLPNKGKAWCLALSSTGRFAAAGFWDGTFRVYDVASLELPDADPAEALVFERRLLHTPTQTALTADGKQLAVFSRKDGLLLIDLESGEQRLIWAAGAASVTCLKFTPDGKLIAGLSDGTARMWSASGGAALLVIEAGHVPHDIAWSPEASLLATAAGKVNLWQCELP
jgi:ferric-dicitrate binding protein FerR (iron transport regulator)